MPTSRVSHCRLPHFLDYLYSIIWALFPHLICRWRLTYDRIIPVQLTNMDLKSNIWPIVTDCIHCTMEGLVTGTGQLVVLTITTLGLGVMIDIHQNNFLHCRSPGFIPWPVTKPVEKLLEIVQFPNTQWPQSASMGHGINASTNWIPIERSNNFQLSNPWDPKNHEATVPGLWMSCHWELCDFSMVMGSC